MLQAFMVVLTCSGAPAVCTEVHLPLGREAINMGPECDAAAADGAKRLLPGLPIVKAYCQGERPGPMYLLHPHADGTVTIEVDHP
jgi:hypothetical protein